MRSSILYIICILLSYSSFSQNQDSNVTSQDILRSTDEISFKSLKYINNKYSKLTKTIEVQSEKLLKRMQEREGKLQRKLKDIDSIKTEALSDESQAKYNELQTKLKATIDNVITTPHTEYIPGLDSLQTIIKFLLQSDGNLSEVSEDKLEQMQSIYSEMQELQGRLQQANQIQNFIRNRESQLKTTLANLNFGKELLGINKEVYYYQERLSEYKQLLNDKKKLEEKVFAVIRNLPAFQKFWQRNSSLAQLFPMPVNYGTPQALAGLQTRVAVQNALTQRISASESSSAAPQQYVQQQMQQAQSELSKLKDKVNKFSSGSSDMTTPDFKANSEKTKSFSERLEYGLNIQNEQGTSFLPAISDIALTFGYKLSDKKTFGIGASYKVGWGHGFNHIHVSSEGIGLRSYADIKAKGSIWITSGFEYNYLQRFNSFEQIKNINVWQRSALLGVSKKYTIGKKKEGSFQLLYDFLAQRQVPQARALKFRIGWAF